MGNEESTPADSCNSKSAPPAMKRSSTYGSAQPPVNAEAPPAYDDLFGPPSSSSHPTTPSSNVPPPLNPAFSGGATLQNNPVYEGFGRVNEVPHEAVQNSSYGSTNGHHGPTPWNTVPDGVVTNSIPNWKKEEEEAELRMWFSTVDENKLTEIVRSVFGDGLACIRTTLALYHFSDGHITSEELRMALLNDNWTPFNVDTIRMMLKMFDKNSNDRIEFEEFAGLKRYVQEWKKVFDQYDADHSGTIDVGEIQQAFRGMGYTFTMDFCTVLCRRFTNNPSSQSVNLDAFIYACAMVSAMSKDHARSSRGITLEEFLRRWISNS